MMFDVRFCPVDSDDLVALRITAFVDENENGTVDHGMGVGIRARQVRVGDTMPEQCIEICRTI